MFLVKRVFSYELYSFQLIIDATDCRFDQKVKIKLPLNDYEVRFEHICTKIIIIIYQSKYEHLTSEHIFKKAKTVKWIYAFN